MRRLLAFLLVLVSAPLVHAQRPGAPTRSGVVSVAAGEQHSLAVLEDGSVWTWGQNSNGELGRQPTEDDYWIPVRVPGVTGLWAAAGTSTSYVYDGETLWTAGYNHSGRLGYGPTGSEETFGARPFPGLAKLDAFGGQIIALLADSTVAVWGDGRSGQMGNGTTPSREQTEPLRVDRLADIVDVGAGGGFLLALQDDGTLWSWGQNHHATLGTPEIESIATTTQLSTTAAGAVAASASGTGKTTFATYPQRVALSRVVAAAAGGEHALAVRADGTVWAWGSNARGALGLRDETRIVIEPIQVPGLAGIVAVAAGTGFSLALQSDGTLWMWGYINGMPGYAAPYHQPRTVLQDVGAVSAGTRHAFIIKRDRSLLGFGLADMGQVGSRASHSETDWPPLRVRFEP